MNLVKVRTHIINNRVNPNFDPLKGFKNSYQLPYCEQLATLCIPQLPTSQPLDANSVQINPFCNKSALGELKSVHQITKASKVHQTTYNC